MSPRRTGSPPAGFTLAGVSFATLVIGAGAAVTVPFLMRDSTAARGEAATDVRLLAGQEFGFHDVHAAFVSVTGSAVRVAAPPDATRLTATVSASRLLLQPYSYVAAQQAGAAGFCLVVKNSHDHSTAVYDSVLGGIQPASATGCQPAGQY